MHLKHCYLPSFQNILEDLQKDFDDEKAALLRSLARQTDKVEQERHRQIELAKLKRDQRRLKKDEKLDVVAMMIQSARQDDRKREEGLVWLSFVYTCIGIEIFAFEPVLEKTNNLGSDQDRQTGLYSHRRWLEAGNFAFRN